MLQIEREKYIPTDAFCQEQSKDVEREEGSANPWSIDGALARCRVLSQNDIHALFYYAFAGISRISLCERVETGSSEGDHFPCRPVFHSGGSSITRLGEWSLRPLHTAGISSRIISG
jgi:hypothetical protein